MDRYWISPEGWREPFSLHGEEARHCARVMRKREGDWIEGFDGKGGWARGPITSIYRDSIKVAVEESGIAPPLEPRIEIAVGIPKGKIFDLIVQKAVELGVSAIHPILCKQGVVRIPPTHLPKKKTKWERVALEACKQCGQNHLPKISIPQDLRTFLPGQDDDSLKVVGALLPETKSMKRVLTHGSDTKTIKLLVGPEGDFSDQEYKMIMEHQYLPVTLGPLVLRVETAVISMISAARFYYF